MTDVDVKKLAELSRIAVSDVEMKQLEQEIPEILAFVEQISEAVGEIKKEAGDPVCVPRTGRHYNIMREDEEPHETGLYTKEMLEAMPNEKEGYLRVRKIIPQD